MTRRHALLALILGSLAACDTTEQPPEPAPVADQPQVPSDAEMQPTRRPPPVTTGAFSADPNNPNGAPGGWTPSSPAGRF